MHLEKIAKMIRKSTLANGGSTFEYVTLTLDKTKKGKHAKLVNFGGGIAFPYKDLVYALNKQKVTCALVTGPRGFHLMCKEIVFSDAAPESMRYNTTFAITAPPPNNSIADAFSVARVRELILSSADKDKLAAKFVELDGEHIEQVYEALSTLFAPNIVGITKACWEVANAKLKRQLVDTIARKVFTQSQIYSGYLLEHNLTSSKVFVRYPPIANTPVEAIDPKLDPSKAGDSVNVIESYGFATERFIEYFEKLAEYNCRFVKMSNSVLVYKLKAWLDKAQVCPRFKLADVISAAEHIEDHLKLVGKPSINLVSVKENKGSLIVEFAGPPKPSGLHTKVFRRGLIEKLRRDFTVTFRDGLTPYVTKKARQFELSETKLIHEATALAWAQNGSSLMVTEMLRGGFKLSLVSSNVTYP